MEKHDTKQRTLSGAFLKMAHSRPLFRLFKHTLQFLQQIYVKNVHPVYGTGIWTHDVSLFP